MGNKKKRLAIDDFSNWGNDLTLPDGEYVSFADAHHDPPWDEMLEVDPQPISPKPLVKGADTYIENTKNPSMSELVETFSQKQFTGFDGLQITQSPEASARFNTVFGKELEDNPRFKYGFAYYRTQTIIANNYLRRIGAEVYQYITKEGRFRPLDDNELKTLIRQDASPEEQSRMSRFEVMDIVERIQTEPTIQVQREFFDNDEYLVNFYNGTLDLRTHELLPHSPDFRLTSFIKANYLDDFTLEGSLFEGHLFDITDRSEEKVKHLQEISGYNLSSFSNVKKATVLDGGRHTGKTTFNSTIHGLLGEENVSHFKLSALNERFTLGKLLTKKVNIFGERGAAILKDCENFKALTGSEWNEAENKNQNFIGRPAKTKLIFAGNKLPMFENPDDNAAFMDRITLFIFGHVFPEKERIRDMEARLLEESDLIASWAMDGLFRLIDNNFVFHEAADAKAMRKSRSSQINVISDFINEHCELQTTSRVFSKDLYERFRRYCHQNAVECLKQVEFTSEVIANTERLGPVHKKIRIGKEGPYFGFEGLGLINSVSEEICGTTEQDP